MRYIKTYEENTDWNKVLHSATWGRPKKFDKYDLDFDNIKKAVENGADVNYCGTMQWAVRNDNFEVVKFMLENGADVNYQDRRDGEWTALMLACTKAYVDIAKILIDFGADPTIGNFQGNTTFKILEIPESKNKDDGDWISKFNWDRTTKEIKEKRDEIFEYLVYNKMNIIKYRNPELAYEKFKGFMDDNELLDFSVYKKSKKYNI
jgi:ankyrin repeat protein